MLGDFDPREEGKCEPDYWFLNAEESRYLDFRTKTWRRSYGLESTYTSNNLVTPLIDGATYMADLFHQLNDMDDDGYVYMVGWQFTPNQYLLEKDAKIDNPSEGGALLITAPRLTELLEGLIGRGVDVRVVGQPLWSSPAIAGAIGVGLVYGKGMRVSTNASPTIR